MSRDIDIYRLTPPERILLAEELWDSLSFRPEMAPIPPEHLEELNRRLEAEARGETTSQSWEEVKQELFPKG
jgi:putative addiction module component (TIGR02574 family)